MADANWLAQGSPLAIGGHGAPSIPSNFGVYGPIAIGTYVGAFGAGAMVLGTAMYLERWPQEKRWIKALLITIAALCAGQSACDCSRLLKITIYHQSLAYFIDTKARPEEVIAPVFNMLICTMVQAFLVFRCSKVLQIALPPSNRGSMGYTLRVWGTVGFLIVCVALCFGAGLGAAISIHFLPNYIYANRSIDSTGTFPTLATIWLSSTAATDVLISSIMVFELWHANRKEESSRMISGMLQVAMQGGVVVTALQIATLVTYLKHNSAWSDFPTIFIAKVYSLTLLATLAIPRSTAAPVRRHTRPSPRRPYSASMPIPMTVPRVTDSWRTHVPELAVPSPARGGRGGYDVINGWQDGSSSANLSSAYRWGLRSPVTIGDGPGCLREKAKAHGESTQGSEDDGKIYGVLDYV